MSTDWVREDLLVVLNDCKDAVFDTDTITTEFEFIMVGELLKRCATEIKHLRKEVEELKSVKVRSRSAKGKNVRRVQKKVR